MILRIVGECDLKQHLSESVTSRPHTKFILSGEYGKPRERSLFSTPSGCSSSYSLDIGLSFPGRKAVGTWRWPFIPPSDKIKKDWIHNSRGKLKTIPRQFLRVPGVWGSQISRQSEHKGGKFVSLTHRPPLPPRKYSWYSFLLRAESTPGP